MAETAKVKNELKALVRDVEVGRNLDNLDNPLGIPSSTGIGRNKLAGAGGITSPVTEQDYNAREYWPSSNTITSSDGLITFVYSPVKKISTLDGDGNPVEFVYADPSA